MLWVMGRRRYTTTEFELWTRKRIQEELTRVNGRIAKLKREPLPEELESGGDNTPLSEETDSTLAVEEKELRTDVLSRLIGRAASLDQALRRLEFGVYGICISCNRPIPRKRLDLLPEVAHCVSCQGNKEEEAKAEIEPRGSQWQAVNELYEKKREYEE
jgi:DnaK suppressor protein